MPDFDMPERLTLEEIQRRLATPAPPDDEDRLLTPAEVAHIFRVDAKTVTRWARAGKLSSIRTVGGHRRYRESDVRELLEAGRQERTS